jgi:hypothetical protein
MRARPKSGRDSARTETTYTACSAAGGSDGPGYLHGEQIAERAAALQPPMRKTTSNRTEKRIESTPSDSFY